MLVDTNNSFDPCSAAAAGVDLQKIYWIRCDANVDHAMRSADLVLHSGGFGVVALDLAEAAESALNRIPQTTWFRWRRAVQATPTVLAVIANRPLTKSCSALLIEMKRRRAVFTGNLLRGAEYELAPRKPIGKERGRRCLCRCGLKDDPPLPMVTAQCLIERRRAVFTALNALRSDSSQIARLRSRL